MQAEVAVKQYLNAYRTGLDMLPTMVQFSQSQRKSFLEQIQLIDALESCERDTLNSGGTLTKESLRRLARQTGISIDRCKSWLNNFLYWRNNSTNL